MTATRGNASTPPDRLGRELSERLDHFRKMLQEWEQNIEQLERLSSSAEYAGRVWTRHGDEGAARDLIAAGFLVAETE